MRKTEKKQNNPTIQTSEQNLQPLLLRSDPPALNVQHWYQLRKRAVSMLKAVAGGQYTLIEPGYRGHHSRHWMRHDECQCVFKASLAEAFRFDAELCPFCSADKVNDMERYGSVAAVQELVHIMTNGRITFSSENALGAPGDQYLWGCEIHKCLLSSTFTRFIANPDTLCKWCHF